MTDINTLGRILAMHKRAAVVGLSEDRSRPGNCDDKYLLEHGFDVIPVNPKRRPVMFNR